VRTPFRSSGVGSFLVLFALNLSAQEPAPSAELKSPGTATLISAGATVGGLALGALLIELSDGNGGSGFVERQAGSAGASLFVGGLVAGPALGYLYADEMRRARGGAIFRAAAGVATAVAIVAVAINELEDLAEGEPTTKDDEIGAIAAVGVGAMAASALIDIVRLPGVVRRHNRELTARARGVTPDAASPPPPPTASGEPRVAVVASYSMRHRAPGIAVRVRL
jgi:hypothetical protein